MPHFLEIIIWKEELVPRGNDVENFENLYLVWNLKLHAVRTTTTPSLGVILSSKIYECLLNRR